MKIHVVILCSLLIMRLNAQSDVPLESFLKSIQEHRIIGLGEQSHGIESFNDVKSALLRAGWRNHPNSNLLIESSFNLSMVHFLTNGETKEWGDNVLFQFWNTDSVLHCMEDFQRRSETLKRPALAGFDMSEDCRYKLTSSFLLQSHWVARHAPELKLADSIMAQCMAPHAVKSRLSIEEKERLRTLYDLIESEVSERDSSMQRDIVLRMIFNRRALCNFLTIDDRAHYFAYRDSMMADNIFWLINHFCKDEKVFLWAANVHLAALDIGPRSSAFMGELIYQRFQGEYYNLDVVRARRGKQFAWRDITGSRRRSSAILKVKGVKLLEYEGSCSD